MHVNHATSGNPAARVRAIDPAPTGSTDPGAPSTTLSPLGVEMELRPWWPIATAAVASSLAVVFVAAAVMFDATGARVGFSALALLCLLPVPDLVLASARGGGLLLAQEGLRYDGWSVGASVAWDDIASVDPDTRDQNRPAFVIRTRPGAASYESWRRSRILLPLERAPSNDEIVLPLRAFDAPGTLAAIIDEVARSPAPNREHLLRVAAVPFLTGRLGG